ncbi:DNA primase large subunit-like isoform X2 [Ceratina calcarata]|nr:DNA primase large subunit-like isoform X2 [Ceratina calcarata]
MAHFLLKSAFAFDTKKISWFVRQEVNLFAWRLCSFPLTSVRRFMKLNDITYPTISMEERREISQALESYRTPKEVEEMNFYKVYFTHVKDLVAHGQVYLRHGTAHVPEPKMGHPIVHNFSKKLKFSAAQGRWVHGMNSSDERFATLTKLLLESAEGYFKRTDNPDEITYEDLDSLSKRSYPLCMRIVHEALRRDHHLTNGGRVQYTLFLKGIGLPFDAAFRLWSTEFRRIVPREEFETEYRYYVEHLYGRVGRMADYQPFGCSKIIDTVLLPRDCHGCPYKSMSTPLLRTTLQEHGLLKLDVEEIIALTERSEHLQACKRYYEATHEVVLSAPFMHPNDYFRSSCERFREAEEWAEEAEEKNLL